MAVVVTVAAAVAGVTAVAAMAAVATVAGMVQASLTVPEAGGCPKLITVRACPASSPPPWTCVETTDGTQTKNRWR